MIFLSFPSLFTLSYFRLLFFWPIDTAPFIVCDIGVLVSASLGTSAPILFQFQSARFACFMNKSVNLCTVLIPSNCWLSSVFLVCIFVELVFYMIWSCFCVQCNFEQIEWSVIKRKVCKTLLLTEAKLLKYQSWHSTSWFHAVHLGFTAAFSLVTPYVQRARVTKRNTIGFWFGHII